MVLASPMFAYDNIDWVINYDLESFSKWTLKIDINAQIYTLPVTQKASMALDQT